MRIERTEGWLFRWRVIYSSDEGMDTESDHLTKLGARFAVLLTRLIASA